MKKQLWKVTGFGQKNKYGRFDKFQTVEVKTEVGASDNDAIELAKPLIKAEAQEKFEAKKHLIVAE